MLKPMFCDPIRNILLATQTSSVRFLKHMLVSAYFSAYV